MATSPPVLDPSGRDSLLYAAGLIAPADGFAPLQPFTTDPPWVLPPERYEDPDDATVLAVVFAAHPIASIGGAEPWLITGTLRNSETGPLLLTRVTVENLADASREVTGTVLRGIPLARIRDRAAAHLDTTAAVLSVLEDLEGWDVEPEDVAWARRAAAEAAKLPLHRGRAGYPKDHYRRLALRAIDLAYAGHRDVLEVLREEERVAYATIKAQVRRARDLGFLAPTTRGRAAFRPGPNLYRKETHDA